MSEDKPMGAYELLEYLEHNKADLQYHPSDKSQHDWFVVQDEGFVGWGATPIEALRDWIGE